VATRVTCRHDVAAGVEAAFAAMTGERWPQALDARLSDGSALVERTASPDGGVRVVTRRRLPEGVPSFLTRFAAPGSAVHQTDVWGPDQGGTRRGTWSVELGGAPATLGGDLVLEPTDGGCRWGVDGQVAVRVPLVGGRAESFLAPLVERLVATQAEVLRTLV
jgi:hypothetical protein